MTKLNKWLKGYWKQLLYIALAVAFVVFLFTFRLNSLTGGVSLIEHNYEMATASFNSVINQPVFLPHKIVTFLFYLLTPSSKLARLPSVLIALALIGSFYVLMDRWYTRRIALMTTLLFATSSWTLTIARQALPTITYLGWLPVLALLYWTISKSKHKVTLLLWSFSLGLAIYIPGLLWFVIVLAASQRKRLRSSFSQASKLQIAVSSLVLMVLLIPFVWSSVHFPSIALQALGIPNTLHQLTNFPRRLVEVFAQIFIISSQNSVFHLGRLPYLDVASTVLMVIGIYRLRYSSARKMMGWSGVIIIGWLIGAGLSTVNIAIFLPLIYIFIGGGISFVLLQWFKVFPKNPIARTTAVVAMTVLVLLISFYHLTRYFIAWPLNPQTKQAFSSSSVRIYK